MSSTDSDTSSEVELELGPVLEAYSQLYSRRVDIIGDYAGNELCLVEGDSLLLHCFDDAHINFDPGFQLLHAAYTVERFLHGLAARRCNFHVAFFEQNRELCVPQWASSSVRNKYLLARAAIIRHLRVNLQKTHPEIEIHVFPSVHSSAFAQYVRATDLYFVMCHDGSSSGVLRKRNTQSSSEVEPSPEERENELRMKTMYRLLVYWFLDQGYNVALVNGLEWLDTKIITTVLESTRTAKRDDFAQMVPGADSFSPDNVPSKKDSLEKIKSSSTSALSEREYLTVLLLSKYVQQKGVIDEFASAMLRQTALLSEIPLSDRSLKATALDANAQKFLLGFVNEAGQILESRAWAEDSAALSSLCDVADLVDGNLFSACIQNSQSGTGPRYETLLEALTALLSTQPPMESKGSSTQNAFAGHEEEEVKTRYAVLPFANEVFEKHLAQINLTIDKSEDVPDARTSMIFQEVDHWQHGPKRPVDSAQREVQKLKAAKQKFYANRRNQWFMAEMMAYAASLTNAVGKALEPEIITVGGSSAPAAALEKKEENAKPKGNPKAAKKKEPVLTKKQQMLADIAASKSKKMEATADKDIAGWRMACKALEQEPNPVSKYQKTKQYLLTLKTTQKRDTLEAEVRLFMLNTLLLIWIDTCRKQKKEESLHLAALVFDAIHTFSSLRVPVTKTITNCLTTTIKVLGLPKLAVPTPQGDRALSFTFALQNPPTVDLKVPLSALQFQLEHCGPYFDRSIDSAPDSRVPFEPDAWQRKVLDEIDARRSLLVIAPTSAGKTFISFYAMKKVLEANNDDILVYVAPTKALVNQIAAEVQARFSKNYKYGGNSVWGIHTRDMRINNPTGCQVLVTVPHILQMMLLTPSNAKSWSERVKWIIFDEVHCIGQAEDGLVWEQLLLLAPCPIIALSATIGNPNEFNAWLQSTQRAIGNDLQMVSHPHRYSDLRKFFYSPPKTFKFEGLSENRAFAQLGLDGCRDFTFIHPVASLTNRARGMPHDFSLEARDCFMLWQSMAKHQTDKYPVSKDLDPSAILPAVVTKKDIITWEAGLKDLLRKWLADTNSPFEAVFKDLNKDLAAVETLTDTQPNTDEEVSENEDGKQTHKSLLPLLTTLHEQDALPGIVFNYDRHLCEEMGQRLLGELESAETNWKETNSKWKAMLDKWETWKKAMAKADKKRPQKISTKKGKGDDEVLSKEDLMRDSANTETSPWASFDPENPVEGFHFADNKKLTQEELAKYVKELVRREVPSWQLNGLKRGIGVHHAGMNRKYRQVVEMLFRKGYLRVVIATGTLALGINMPCKTVIFSGDSVFLTALNYRQAAGRAGRRGFDMLGNVVFHGLSTNKIRRLMSSRLPDLHGHFPITTTLVLRLLTLLHESKNSPFAIRSVNALLSQPRLYLGGEESKSTVLHHLRFSIEYLRRNYLLGPHGEPLHFAPCVNHLYFTENSSFAFHALLKGGYFHKLCADVEKSPERVTKDLMLSLAHLFGRIHCRQADKDYMTKAAKKSASMVFLPPLPETAADMLRRHNSSTQDVFQAYVQTFIEQHVQDADNELPLTQIKVGGESTESAKSLERHVPTTVRSPFVALSGHGDKFSSIHDLCSTIRSGVFLEEAIIPYVGVYPEEAELPLNAYLLDFFTHGDVATLASANRIRAGDVWFVLNDFSMVLATIVASLSNFMNLTSESDLSMTDVRGEGEEEEERQEDKFIPETDSGYETASTASMATGMMDQGRQVVPMHLKKKKKVEESWEDDADEEDFQASLAAEKEKKRKAAEGQTKASWEEGEGLLNVLKAFKTLREEFDTKFRAMWA